MIFRRRPLALLALASLALAPFACNGGAPAASPEGVGAPIVIPSVVASSPVIADASAPVANDDPPPAPPDAAAPEDASGHAFNYPDLADASFVWGSVGGIGLGGQGTGVGVTDGGAKTVKLRVGPTEVNGRLPPEVIQRIVRQNFGRFRLCYDAARKTKPKLAGKVTVRFVIDANGAVRGAADAGSTVGDAPMVSCVTRGFSAMSFPQPESGEVTVKYTVEFAFD